MPWPDWLLAPSQRGVSGQYAGAVSRLVAYVIDTFLITVSFGFLVAAGIMLIGLVKKNGIMMIDFAIDAQKDPRNTPEQAIYDACLIRFRPIMMTTFAALLGTLPIALGWGAGAEARRTGPASPETYASATTPPRFDAVDRDAATGSGAPP